MKIVCDKCTTKYSIADEKVRGKVFKIRCKKCSHIIVVKGSDSASAETSIAEPLTDNEDGATVAGSMDAFALVGAGERVWYMVVGGEQVGPFNVGEVRARWTNGEVDGDTYGWREGFGDWLRLAAIDDFRDLGGASGEANGGGETRRTDVGELFAAQQAAQNQQDEDEGAADIFGGRRGPEAATAIAASPARAAAGVRDDLFGAHGGNSAGGASNEQTEMAARPRTSLSAGGGAGVGAGASLAAVADDAKLTGQRNENSVLFSLSNLQALASSGAASRPTSGSAPASSQPAPQPAARAGYATANNEGSGLIDIRAMAAATLSSVGPSSSSKDSPVELPSFSAAPVFSPVVAAPIMVPSQSSAMPKWVWALVAMFGLVFLTVVGGLWAVLTRPPQAGPPPVVAINTNPPAPAGAIAAPPAVAQPPVAGGAAAGVVAAVPGKAPEAAAPVKAEREAPRGKNSGKSTSGKSHEKPASIGAAPTQAAVPAARTKPSDEAKSTRKPSKDSTLDDLLDGAASTGGGAKKAAAPREAAPPADDPSLPDQLDRGALLAGMKAVQPKAMACFQTYHVPGLALVAVVIAKTGRVSSANVGGALAGTPTGDCVGKAVKTASFGKFKGAPMSIQYPFSLR